jgi:hypothetical protein
LRTPPRPLSAARLCPASAFWTRVNTRSRPVKNGLRSGRFESGFRERLDWIEFDGRSFHFSRYWNRAALPEPKNSL